MIRLNPDITPNQTIQEIIDARNNRPDPEIGGLSPNQVYRLIHLPWEDNNFPIKFHKNIELSQLKDSVFFTNTKILLTTLLELKNIDTATAKRNLNRKVVQAVFDSLVLDSETRADILRFNKVINEDDVLPLNVVRIVCEEAKLILCRKKKFLVSSRGKELLQNDKAGQLYYELFNSYFKKFNTGYVDRLPALDCVQHTIGYSFYRLSRIADDFVNMEELFDEILLPTVRDEIREKLPPILKVEWLIESRIIGPLTGFGLLECRSKEKRYREIVAVRKTALFDRFMRWEG
jgi:hypothetical protein